MSPTKDELLHEYYAAVAAIVRGRYNRVLSLFQEGAAPREDLETAELNLLKADLDLALHGKGSG